MLTTRYQHLFGALSANEVEQLVDWLVERCGEFDAGEPGGAGMSRFLSGPEAARMCGVSPQTIHRWVEAGRLPGTLKLPGRRHHYRIPLEAVEAVIAAMAHGPPPRARQERTRGHKLTAASVLSIRQRRAAGESPEMLAGEYGISVGYLLQVCQGRYWQHVGGPLTDSPRTTKLGDEQVREIREAFSHGDRSQAELAQAYGVSRSLVSLLVRGKRRQDAGGPVVEE
jgi:excisionase family DNA binding protein